MIDHEDEVILIIEARANVPDAKLSRKDRATSGHPAVEGDYRIKFRDTRRAGADAEKRALDVFHDIVPISRPEDFDITVRPAMDDELEARPENIKQELGTYTVPVFVPMNKPGGNSMDDDKITMIVEVTAVVDFEDLPSSELGSDGTPSKDGSYRVTLTGYEGNDPREEVANVVQDMTMIDQCEDYQFLVRPATQDEIEADPATFRDDYTANKASPDYPAAGGMAP